MSLSVGASQRQKEEESLEEIATRGQGPLSRYHETVRRKKNLSKRLRQVSVVHLKPQGSQKEEESLEEIATKIDYP